MPLNSDTIPKYICSHPDMNIFFHFPNTVIYENNGTTTKKFIKGLFTLSNNTPGVKLTCSECSVKLKDVLSSQLFSNLANFLSDCIQFYICLIQYALSIWNTSNEVGKQTVRGEIMHATLYLYIKILSETGLNLIPKLYLKADVG